MPIVPISDEVRKHDLQIEHGQLTLVSTNTNLSYYWCCCFVCDAYHSQSASERTVPMSPLKNNTKNWRWFGNSNTSIWVKFNTKNTGHINSKFHSPTNPVEKSKIRSHELSILWVFNEQLFCRLPKNNGMSTFSSVSLLRLTKTKYDA